MAKFRKPWRPTIQRGHPLVRRLLYAVAAGWNRGFEAANGLTDRDDITMARGDILGSTGVTFDIRQMGTCARSGGSPNSILWSAAPTTKYDLANEHYSAFVLGFGTKTPNSNAFIFARRLGFALGEVGWCFAVLPAGTVTLRQSNGVGIDSATFASGLMLNMAQLFAMTYDPVADDLLVFMNGFLDGSNLAAPNAPGNPAIGISLFGAGDDSDKMDTYMISAAALWEIKLPPRAMANLQIDPYAMWKPAHREFMFGFAAVKGPVAIADCCCPCCGGFPQAAMGL